MANVLLAILFGAGLFFVLDYVIWPLSFCVNTENPDYVIWPLSYWVSIRQPAPVALCLLHSVGLPLTFGAMILGGFVEMAVLGRVLSEYEREWRSRMAAILLMGVSAWVLMVVVVFLVPWAFSWASSQFGNVTGTNVKAFITGLWAAISGGGAWIARRATSPGEPAGTPRWARALMLVAPAVFLIGLFAGVAVLGQDLVEWLAGLNFLSDWEAPERARGLSFFGSAVSWPQTNWCGGRLTGYARTPRQRRRANNLTLGRVMTVSGAAVDPNMNVVSPPLTALMTLFNTRLGWWIENPDPDRGSWFRRGLSSPWAASEPALGTRLLSEFLGLTDESSKYVHVSDGGHFENLGVYELIHQRCRFIIVADAGTDRVAASDNMAAMLRLIRTDFGIRVELDPARMQLGGANNYSDWHCSVGRIRYDEVDEKAVPGLLVYLQATLTGDEPPDLLQYVSRHPSFPRQSTVNQFFDEAQFEAYRALGHHVATQVFGDSASAWTGAAPSSPEAQAEVRNFFTRVRQQWLEPLNTTSAEWLAASKAALELEQHFDGKAELKDMIHAIYPEVGPGPLPGFQAVNQTLQVMELAWSAMKLSEFHTHPANRGWMNTFRRWTASTEFHWYWPFLRAEYSRPFVSFCEDILNLQPTAPDCKRVVGLPTDLKVMDDQFGYEWSDQFELLRLPSAGFPRQGYVQDTLQQVFPNPPPGQPLVWRISQGATLPCGIACVAVTPRQRLLEPHLVPAGQPHPPGEAEFVIWLRGAYRSMGIGRQAAAKILHEIDQETALWPPPRLLRYLVAYYPLRNGTVGPDPELDRWMDFFFDLGFRRHRQPEQGPGAKFVIVKRKVG